MRTMVLTCSRNGEYVHGYLTGMMAAQRSPEFAGAAWSVLESDIARARNTLCEQALRVPEVEAVLFVDDDMVFSGEDFERVARLPECDVLGGVYVKRKELAAEASAGGQREVYLGPMGKEWPGAPEVVEVVAVGAGFMRIARRVLEGMKGNSVQFSVGECSGQKGRGWHDWFAPGMFGGRYLSEDYGFCWKARAHGFGVWLHRGVRCGHVGRKVFR